MILSKKKKEKKLLIYFFVFIFILSGFILFILAESGTVFLGLSNFSIFIHSPQNTTYNFSSIFSNYTLQLNASADKIVNSWWYTLIDLTHNTTVYSNVSFTPNSTVNVTRFSNKLIVYANDSGGNIQNSSVIFYVLVPNSAPMLNDILTQQYACEGSFLFYTFTGTDVDEDDLSLSTTFSSPFFVDSLTDTNATLSNFEIFSGVLSKSNAGGPNIGHKNYSGNVSISDSNYSDSELINITVIEINNPPVLSTIGVRTVWVNGSNNTFNYTAIASDLESSGLNKTFNVSFLGSQLFNISSSGVVNYTASLSHLGVHNITVCTTDGGILHPHQNISLCSQNGGNLSDCETFGLTVTIENRAPDITSYYPNNTNLIINGNDNLYFNITDYDLDGTYPDSYWYVDGILREYDNNSLYDEFYYTFGCNVSGNHYIKVVSTDGELNDSIQWNINVNLEICPAEMSGSAASGSGGSGGVVYCSPNWGCENWQDCNNLISSRNELDASIYKSINERCELFNYNDNECGFQIRSCIDVNRCRTLKDKPGIIKECQYSLNPSCSDGILNCHNGACEIFTDCGGFCNACPTCSDGIKNQNEEGIDCGGACTICIENPSLPVSTVLYFFIIFFVSSLLIISFLTIRAYYFYKKRKKEERKRSSFKLYD